MKQPKRVHIQDMKSFQSFQRNRLGKYNAAEKRNKQTFPGQKSLFKSGLKENEQK